LLAGWSASPVSGNKTATNYGSGSWPSSDFWVVRLDANGQKLWDRTYGGNDNELAWSAQLTSDGGVIVGGGSISGPSGTKTSTNYGDYDFWIVRLDADGNQLWDQSFGGTEDHFPYSLDVTRDGGIMVGGRSLSGLSGNKTSSNFGVTIQVRG